ncbi:type IV toxin-antitoxin system AbiEi family antitoxin domain-containing protein [Propionibacterium freudenreichii]|nr:type IV toxin-antitoxin system AbiEi family antitoxin domain-containing protein [Propionibacterium freudenreichii]
MKKRIEPGTDLLVLAARQGGCLTWTQCAAHGLTRSAINRLLAASWTRTASGIYCMKRPGSDGDSRYLIPISRLLSLGTA